MATSTQPATSTVTVTSRSRNLGYGWTNQPHRYFAADGSDYLAIEPVTAPDVVGTPRQCLAELQRARRGNSGNFWRGAVFVGGRRVVSLDEMFTAYDLLEYLCERGASCEVEVED